MNCETMREKLPLLAGSLLSAEESHAAKLHFSGWAACRGVFADLELIHGVFAARQSESRDSRFVAAVMKRIEARPTLRAEPSNLDLFDRVLVVGVALISAGAIAYAVNPEMALPYLAVPDFSPTTSLIGLALLGGFALWQMGDALAALGNSTPRRGSV